MKKVFQLLSLVFLFGLTLVSCTSSGDDNAAPAKLLKKVMEINNDGSSSIYNFTYNGDKIVTITSDTNSQTFTYTGNLITRIVELNNVTQHQATFNYIYTNERLIKVTCSDNYELNYVYNANGTVSYEKTTLDANNNRVLVFHGVMSFQGQNLSDNKKTLDDTAPNVLSEETVSFAYDTKQNPFDNITGYSKLLDHSTIISGNNTASTTEIATVSYLDTNQVTSSLIQHPRAFQYDADGYPTEIVSDKPVFETLNANHLKSVYIYQ